MISERSFTIQGKIVKVAPIAATSQGVQFGRILVQTDEIGQDGQQRTAHYGIEFWGKALENVYPKAQAGQTVKVQGNIQSTQKQTADGTRKFLNYSLRANYMAIDPQSAVVAAPQPVQPAPQYAPVPPEPQYIPPEPQGLYSQQAAPQSNPLVIDPDDLPF